MPGEAAVPAAVAAEVVVQLIAPRKLLSPAYVDAGDGWLIFSLPPAEMGVHPSDSPRQEITLTCDDIEATVAELKSRGIRFEGEPTGQGWGITINMVLPGGVTVMLYQPRHPTAPSTQPSR